MLMSQSRQRLCFIAQLLVDGIAERLLLERHDTGYVGIYAPGSVVAENTARLTVLIYAL